MRLSFDTVSFASALAVDGLIKTMHQANPTWGAPRIPHYHAECAREETEVREKAKVEAQEVAEALAMQATAALAGSVGITLLALAIFGYVKGHFTGASPVRSSIQTVLIGGAAATAAFVIARAIS